MNKKATIGQFLQIGHMINDGSIGFEEAEAILAKRFVIQPKQEPESSDSLIATPESPLVMGPFHVKIDLSMSVVEMVKAAHFENEEFAIRELTEERFPIKRKGVLQYEKDLYLIAPSREGMLMRQWQKERRKNQWIDERLPEMLALATYFPDLQRESYIKAFGSLWRGPGDGSLYSPGLWSGDGGRGADALWCNPDGRWSLPYRALVSRKQDLGRLVA